MSTEQPPSPPQISPYVFPFILAVMGLWCLYDGWFSTDPGMQEHLLFNRIAGAVLVIWASIDFYRTRKFEKLDQAAQQLDHSDS